MELRGPANFSGGGSITGGIRGSWLAAGGAAARLALLPEAAWLQAPNPVDVCVQGAGAASPTTGHARALAAAEAR